MCCSSVAAVPLPTSLSPFTAVIFSTFLLPSTAVDLSTAEAPTTSLSPSTSCPSTLLDPRFMPRVGTGGAGGAGCAGCADDSGGFGGTGSSVGVGGACGGLVSEGGSWKLAGLSGSGGSANVGSGLCLDFTCGFAPSWLALVVPFMTISSPATAVGSVGVVVGLIDGEGCTDSSDCTDVWLGTGTGSTRVAGMIVPMLHVVIDAMVPIVSSLSGVGSGSRQSTWLGTVGFDLMVTDLEWRPCGSCEGAPAFSDGTGSAGV